MSELPEHVARNRAYWDDLAQQYVEAGERAWAQEEPTWGIWQVPEAELQIFSEQLAGKGAIELGSGTAYISAWLSLRGARVVGIDNSEAQLGTARRLQRQYGLDFPLILGDAQAIAYPDASFDFAISEYGACLWADPQHWVPEAARVLRPGGRLVFLTNSFRTRMSASTPRSFSRRKASPARWPLASRPQITNQRIRGLASRFRTTFSIPMFSVSQRPQLPQPVLR
jgi:SAM-dependent methyltransferase